MKFITKTYEIHSDKMKNGQSISMVLLSDLHLAEYGADNEDLIRAIKKINPDLILSSGDMVTAKVEHDTIIAERLFADLAKDYPVYYVPGNHEERLKAKREWFGDKYEEYCDVLRSAGVHYLYNEQETICLNNIEIRIYGLALPLPYFQRMSRIDLKTETIEQLIGTPAKETFNILLAHHPRYAESYFAWEADLTLSGHVHGGVMRLGNQACISPDLSVFPRYGYGKFQRKDRTLIVSGGLGEHTIPFRILNPKELIHITIK